MNGELTKKLYALIDEAKANYNEDEECGEASVFVGKIKHPFLEYCLELYAEEGVHHVCIECADDIYEHNTLDLNTEYEVFVSYDGNGNYQWGIVAA